MKGLVNMVKLTEEEMAAMMESADQAVTGTATEETDKGETEGISPLTVRKLMVIGCGDGGCNVATAIARKIPDETFVITYNTSKRNVNDLVSDVKVYVTTDEDSKIVDGAGKSRDYSKKAFKLNAYKNLLEAVNIGLTKMPDISYIIICSTADGGTGSGSSPMIAKLLEDNFDVPVLLMGIFPSMSEDATAQYNALEWQNEVERIGIPYFILDNNQPGIKPQVHLDVNNECAMIASLLAGKEFGNSSISIIDNRNLYMLLIQMRGRLVAAVDTTRPSAGQSLDDYILNALKRNYQPEPTFITGIGVFIKGPKSLLDKMDTAIPGVHMKYGNAVILHFDHIEISEDIEIAILLTGCPPAVDRIQEMKARYDDIISAQKSVTSTTSTILSEMKNPLGEISEKKRTTEKKEVDMSALEL